MAKRTYIRSAPNPKATPDLIREAIRRVKAGETKTAVAKAVGIDRVHLWRLLRDHAPQLIRK